MKGARALFDSRHASPRFWSYELSALIWPMLRACLVVAAARASHLNVQEAAVIVRGRAVSILSSKGCFTVAGSPCNDPELSGEPQEPAHAV